MCYFEMTCMKIQTAYSSCKASWSSSEVSLRCVSPLSQAVVVDRTMYISGQLGLDVASGQLVDGGVQAQAKQVSEDSGYHASSSVKKNLNCFCSS